MLPYRAYLKCYKESNLRRRLTSDELYRLHDRIDQPETDTYIVMTDATGAILGGESCPEPHDAKGAIIAGSLPHSFPVGSKLMVAIVKDGVLTEIHPY
jgi:hypothetical protein